jgi:hypothetical protein
VDIDPLVAFSTVSAAPTAGSENASETNTTMTTESAPADTIKVADVDDEEIA